MRNALGFLSGVVFVVLLAVAMNASAQTEPPPAFDPLVWAQSPEGIEAIGTYFGAGLIFPVTGFAIGAGFGVLLRLIGGDR